MIFLIEFAHKIEEKRLRLGILVEAFLIKLSLCLKTACFRLFNNQYSALYLGVVIILLSIFLRSSRDLGHDSLAVIDMSRLIVGNQKYYHDFIENNLPLFFYLNYIPLLLAKYVDIADVIIVDLWYSFLGILGIYSCARILKKSLFVRDNQLIFNIVIISFLVGYFLRVFTLSYNEFGTKSSYFLLFSYIYLSYFLVSEAQWQKYDHIIVSIIAALLFCLKPHYFLMVLVVECYKAHQKKSLGSLFCLRNYVTLLFCLGYVSVLLVFYPELIVNVGNLSALYYENKEITKYIMNVVVSDFYVIFLALFLLYFIIKRDAFLEKILLFALFISMIVPLEMVGGYDQRFVAYSLFLPAAMIAVCYIIKQDLINISRDWFVILMCVVVVQFDAQNIVNLMVNIVYFWWIFMLVDVLLYKKNGFFGSNIVRFWCIFALLCGLELFFLMHSQYHDIGWVLGAILFVYYLFLHEKSVQNRHFSSVFVAAITIILSYVIALYLQGMFHFKEDQYFKYKTPNYVSEQILYNVAQKEGDFIIISDGIYDIYPVRNITKLGYQDPVILSYDSLYNFLLNTDDLYNNISMPNQYLLDSITKKLLDDDNETIIINNADPCRVGFLEFYFGDVEFKKSFLEHYEFSNRIIDQKDDMLDENLYVGDFYDMLDHRKVSRIIADYEVYVRKK